MCSCFYIIEQIIIDDKVCLKFTTQLDHLIRILCSILHLKKYININYINASNFFFNRNSILEKNFQKH